MVYVLYNPLAANNQGEAKAKTIDLSSLGEAVFEDVTKTDVSAFVEKLTADDALVIAGGDGTLNHFINDMPKDRFDFPVFFYPAGSGNDFFTDVKDKAENGMIRLDAYIKDLPTVFVNGTERKFINGIGYGIDGYCCEVGDKMKAEKPGKDINYAGIAIKGLLFHYKRPNAKVVVDGVAHEYKKVWLAPAMNGRYYGGGMDVAPEQDRLNEERKLSLVVMHKANKLKTLIVFPNIFKGKHVEHTEMVEVLTGKEISVEFDRPTALQIDGETVLGVTKYEAKSFALVAAKA